MTSKKDHPSATVTRIGQQTGRLQRADGDNTRQQILETAGQLFADLGYGGTTSKLICEECGCNVAAVNYHFGSRDGLYSSVLVESHRRLIGFNTLLDITKLNDDPREKLSRVVDTFIDGMDSDQWHSRLFIREIMTPSVFIDEMIEREAIPKFSLVKMLISEITGIDANDPAISLTVLSAIGPCMLLLVGHRDNMCRVMGNIWEDKAALKSHLKSFLFAGLDAMRDQHLKALKENEKTMGKVKSLELE